MPENSSFVTNPHLDAFASKIREKFSTDLVSFGKENYSYARFNFLTAKPPKVIDFDIAKLADFKNSIGTLGLKSVVSSVLKQSLNEEELKDAADFVIKTWGYGWKCNNSLLYGQTAKKIISGVSELSSKERNDLEPRLKFFKNFAADIGETIPSIASWSKLLAFALPDQYPIYDFRIAELLNKWWKETMGSLACPFALPGHGSRNLEASQVAFETYGTKAKNSEQYISTYQNYCALIYKLWDVEKDGIKTEQECYENLLDEYKSEIPLPASGLQLMEMALFAKSQTEL